MGARSDWNSANGDTDGDAHDDDDDTQSNGAPSRTWSIYKEDGDANIGKPRPDDDPDDPINRYVQDQLQRIKTNEGVQMEDELSALNDGATDEN